MNWDAIGAIGESIGAAAVVISLVYLGIQIRQGAALTRLNTKAMHARAFQDLLDHHSNVHLHVSTREDIRQVLRRALDHEMQELSDDERMQYGSFMSQQLRSYYTGFTLLQEGLISEEQWQSFAASLSITVRSRAFPGWWAFRKDQFPADFQAFVESKFDA